MLQRKSIYTELVEIKFLKNRRANRGSIQVGGGSKHYQNKKLIAIIEGKRRDLKPPKMGHKLDRRDRVTAYFLNYHIQEVVMRFSDLRGLNYRR